MFNTSQKILKEMECHIIGEIYTNDNWLSRIIGTLKSVFIYPLKLLKVGLEHGLIKDASKFSFISFVIMFVIALLIKDQDLGVKNLFFEYMFFPLAIILPFLLTLFPIPSSLASHNVSIDHINFVVSLLQNNGLVREETIEIFRRNIKAFEQRIVRRINILRAGLALLWTYYLYLYNSFIKASPTLDYQSILNAMESLSFFILFILAYFILLDSYRKANNIIYRSLEFGANEHSYKLLNNENNI